MLVLSRRVGQGVSFPNLDVTIEVTQIRGNSATFGIRAPRAIKVLRSELLDKRSDSRSGDDASHSLASLDSHQYREQLHTATLALHSLVEQIESDEKADRTLLHLAIEQLESLKADLKRRRALCSGRKALLVEDNQHECNLLASFLRQIGLKVRTANSSAAALSALSALGDHPDIMVLDLNLNAPGDTNYVQQLRGLVGDSQARLYGVCKSGSADNASIPLLDRCFEKPLNPEALAEQIKQDLAA